MKPQFQRNAEKGETDYIIIKIKGLPRFEQGGSFLFSVPRIVTKVIIHLRVVYSPDLRAILLFVKIYIWFYTEIIQNIIIIGELLYNLRRKVKIIGGNDR